MPKFDQTSIAERLQRRMVHMLLDKEVAVHDFQGANTRPRVQVLFISLPQGTFKRLMRDKGFLKNTEGQINTRYILRCSYSVLAMLRGVGG